MNSVNKKVLAVIPARKGSKRLPNKNLMLLAGKPLIVHTIEAALNCSLIHKVIVTTDCKKIADISRRNGAEIPFIRPASLSSDNATSIEVVLHAIKELENNGQYFDVVVLLQPTSPFRKGEHITQALALLEQKKSKGIISVCEVEHSPLWCNILPSDLSMDNFITTVNKNKRSQDFPTYYRLNGAIYISLIGPIKKQKTFFLEDELYAYVMEKNASVDIDNLDDFEYAEFLASRKRVESNH